MTPAPLLLAAALTATAAPADTLSLDAVLSSAVQRHPAVLAARQGVARARGAQVSARGAFDTKVSASGGAAPVGPYRSLGADLQVAQPTRVWGARVQGGVRYGADFPGYKGELVTPSAGQVYAGVQVPLLRDRAVDPARFGLQQGVAGVTVAEATLADTRLAVARAAGEAWVAWVAAGTRVRIARTQAGLADARMQALQGQLARGAIAALTVTDNQRSLLARRAKVVAAELKLQQSALKLGLFVRDARGRMRPPPARRLPPLLRPPPSPTAAVLRRGLETLMRRPDLRRARAELAVLRRSLGLQRQALLPRLDLAIESRAGVGEAREWLPGVVTKPAVEVFAKVKFSLPVQRRKAEGKRLATQAKVREKAARLRLKLDKATAGAQVAFAAWIAATQQTRLSDAALAAALTVAEGERRKLTLGRSDLLRVQLREQNVAKAALERVKAAEAAHRARLRFLAETAQLAAGDS